jgi:Mrp family chromosome partitioning ATPase
VFQTIPIDGMVFVLTPQDLAALIVKKAMNMARELHVPLLGLVENMSYITCPDCGRRIDLFGVGRVTKIAEEYGVPLLGKIPVVPEISGLSDAGHLEEHTGPEVAALADAFVRSVDEITKGSTAVL